MTEVKIGIVGAGGRMGRMLVAAVAGEARCRLVAASESPGSALLGCDAGELAAVGPLGVALGGDAGAVFQACDVVIDFTTPTATLEHAEHAARMGKVLVVGTTGLTAEQDEALAALAQKTAILKSGNMSLGINLLEALVRRVAATLDPSWDIEIVEMHHRHKVDAPSGTALMLGRAAADGRNTALDAVAQTVRSGQTGARPTGEIGFATLRGGDVIGEHSVIFAGAGERIEITHKAGDRMLFARGAVNAALWAHGRPAGLYSMDDVLAL